MLLMGLEKSFESFYMTVFCYLVKEKKYIES